MNFYFNYFSDIGREQSICHVTLSRLHFPEKVDFPDGIC